MKRKYCYQYYRREKNNIRFYLLNKPKKDGFAGMIQSAIFIEPIALIVSDEKMQELECCYAMLTAGKEMKVPRIIMEKEVFFDFRRNSPKAKTIIFHEIGHYINNDLSNYNESYYTKRIEMAKEQNVIEMEIRADFFACDYLGQDIVIQGLAELKNDMKDEEDILAGEELQTRIRKIKDKN